MFTVWDIVKRLLGASRVAPSMAPYIINSPRNPIVVFTVPLPRENEGGGEEKEGERMTLLARVGRRRRIIYTRARARADSYLSLVNNLFSRDVSSRQIRRRVIITARTLERIKEDPSRATVDRAINESIYVLLLDRI